MSILSFLDPILAFFSRKPKPQKQVSLEEVKVSKPFVSVYSERAERIQGRLHEDHFKALDKGDSLACVLWALKRAEEADCHEGVSVHDVSALLYQTVQVQLYPINVSRLMFKHENLFRQVSQEKKTKRYLLTPEGTQAFAETDA